MAGWRATIVLASVLVASSATTNSYGNYHHSSRPHGDHDPRVGPGMSLTAYFNMGGIRGEICFTQAEPSANVTITVKLDGLRQFEPQPFDWNIHEQPVRFSEYLDFPCSELTTGGVYGPESECDQQTNLVGGLCLGAVASRVGSLVSTSTRQVYSDGVLSLFGPYSPVGRSVVIRDTVRGGLPIACANIEYQGISLQTLRAGFSGELHGDVILRRQNGRPGTTLRVELRPSCGSSLSTAEGMQPQLRWELRNGTCDDIGTVVGRDTFQDEIHHGAFDRCSPEFQRECPAGNLTGKCGPLMFARGRYRGFCTDDQLGLLSYSALEETILVFYAADDGRFIDCQPWKPINQLCARVNCIKRPRIRIDVLFFQSDPTDRTHVRSYITGLDQDKLYLQVRRDPVTDGRNCTAGGIFDKPRNAQIFPSHVSDPPTGEILPIGVLEHKITSPRGRQSVVRQDTTSWLPLFGPYSIIGRSLVLVDTNGNPVACCNIEPVTDPSPDLINSILGYQEESNRPAGK